MAKDKKKKKTIFDLTEDELIEQIKTSQAEGDMLNYVAAKDELERRKTEQDRKTAAEENPDKVEKFQASKIPEYIGEAASLITPSKLVEGAKTYASNLGAQTPEDRELYKKAAEEYNKTFGTDTEEPVTEEITEDVTTTPEAETVTTTEETIPEVTTNAETTPAKKSFDWRNSIEDMAKYGGALYDSLTAMHKRKANQAAALSGFAGQYGSTTPIFAEEETEAPLEKLRKQAYENYTSQMRAAQEAENKALQTDIKNKYKSIYDIDAQNTAERQAYINEKLGTVQNDLNINLNKKLREMNKAELTDYLKRLQDNLDKISDRIKDEGFINGLKNSLPDLIRLSQEGQLTGQMIGTNADVVGNSITGALDAGSTIGTLLSKVF